MAGLDPAIHPSRSIVDGRLKGGHDIMGYGKAHPS